MRIKEVSGITQLSVGNIRFYEKKGLLLPRRKEKGYRSYTEEDVERLKQIQNLRMLGLSVEQVRECLEGEVSLPDMLRERMSQIEKEREELTCQQKLCGILNEKNCSVRALNACIREASARYEKECEETLQKIRKKDLMQYRIRLGGECMGILVFLLVLEVCVMEWIKLYFYVADFPLVGLGLLLVFFIVLGITIVFFIRKNEN